MNPSTTSRSVSNLRSRGSNGGTASTEVLELPTPTPDKGQDQDPGRDQNSPSRDLGPEFRDVDEEIPSATRVLWYLRQRSEVVQSTESTRAKRASTRAVEDPVITRSFSKRAASLVVEHRPVVSVDLPPREPSTDSDEDVEQLIGSEGSEQPLDLRFAPEGSTTTIDIRSAGAASQDQGNPGN